MSTQNTELTEHVASLHTKFALVKEITDLICNIDREGTSEEEKLVAQVLKKLLEKKFTDLEKDINSVKQNVDAEVSEMKLEIEKFKNA